jgi:hypothetical protein
MSDVNGYSLTPKTLIFSDFSDLIKNWRPRVFIAFIANNWVSEFNANFKTGATTLDTMTASITTLSRTIKNHRNIMLSFGYAVCYNQAHNGKRCYAEHRYAEHRYAEHCYAEHRYAECLYARCLYAESH